MADNQTLNIEILDDIGGWGFTFQDLYSKARGFEGSKIRVPVNSYGGSALEGLLIYNFLKGSGKEIETHIPTYAMSAGTIIAAAGDHVTMSTNGYYMIHNPWSVSMGDASDMAATAELLSKIENDLVNIYVKKTGLPAEEIREMMNAETWLTSEEALEKGFVDALTEGAKIEASFDPKKFESFANVPQDIQNLFEAPTPEPEAETTPPTNSFLSFLADIFNKKQTEIDLSQYVAKADHESEIEALKNEITEKEADLMNQHNKDIEAKQTEIEALKAEIEALKAEIEALKKTPIEPETAFETTPAKPETNNNFLTSFDRRWYAEKEKKRNN